MPHSYIKSIALTTYLTSNCTQSSTIPPASIPKPARTPSIMNSNMAFIIKLALVSAAISLAIKYGGPSLSIPPSSAIALIAVLTPSLILAAILSWKALKPVKSS